MNTKEALRKLSDRFETESPDTQPKGNFYSFQTALRTSHKRNYDMDRKCNLSNFSTTDPRNYKNTPCKATTKRKERKQFRSFAAELVHNTVDKSMDSQAKASLNDSIQKRPTLEAVLASYRSNRTKRVTPEPQNYVSASKHMQTSSFSTTMGMHS